MLGECTRRVLGSLSIPNSAWRAVRGRDAQARQIDLVLVLDIDVLRRGRAVGFVVENRVSRGGRICDCLINGFRRRRLLLIARERDIGTRLEELFPELRAQSSA